MSGLIKYRTGSYGSRIEPIQCTRETEASVFISTGGRERRETKAGSYSQYHNSWADAHAYLIECARSKVACARRELELANGELGNVTGMKPPKVTP